jgi:hypothetical protein
MLFWFIVTVVVVFGGIGIYNALTPKPKNVKKDLTHFKNDENGTE